MLRNKLVNLNDHTIVFTICFQWASNLLFLLLLLKLQLKLLILVILFNDRLYLWFLMVDFVTLVVAITSIVVTIRCKIWLHLSDQVRRQNTGLMLVGLKFGRHWNQTQCSRRSCCCFSVTYSRWTRVGCWITESGWITVTCKGIDFLCLFVRD